MIFGCTLHYVCVDDIREHVTLSTTPDAPDTHWKQLALWLQPEHRQALSSGDRVMGTLQYLRATHNARAYDITVTWRYNRVNGYVEHDASGPESISAILTQKFTLR